MEKMNNTTILLYSDARIDLKKYAYEYTIDIFKNKEIEYVEQDVIYLENIKISDCREIVEKAIESSYKGLKVFILNLNGIRNEASNSLLKIIEEPPRDTIFLLLSNNKDSILDTILSRCIKKYIKPKTSTINNYIYEIFDGNIEYINEYESSDIEISNYEINNFDDTLEAIEQYYKTDKNIYTFLKFKFALKYLIMEVKFESSKNKMTFIQNIIDKISNDREITLELLNKLTLLVSFKVSKKVYEILVNLKNSIKNNTNVRAIIYMYLCIILEEV
ncbi:hypothetical protein [Oceanivirga salmonicida]|uniref:hypothetical protein n=1 Tax=Oceanivirga salmonicida TaxID=1769291 RepID=UPI0008351E00|nr:hypothetical protein [Oceanivirga salmonicida]